MVVRESVWVISNIRTLVQTVVVHSGSGTGSSSGVILTCSLVKRPISLLAQGGTFMCSVGLARVRALH